MKFTYAVKRFFKSKNSYVLLILLALTVVIISASYAMFTTTIESKGSLNIVTGKLYTKMISSQLDKDNEIVLEPAETKTVTIKLKNVNPIAAKYNLYYSLSKENANIEIGYTSADIAPVQEGFVIASGEEKTINVKITNNEETDNITVSFGTTVGLQNKELQFPVNKLVLNSLLNQKPLIAAYTYVEPTNIVKDGNTVTSYDGCITGEEEQCVETTCYENKTAGSCPTGTIIKYRVNDSEEKYFHVLYDDGETITMQQRENTIVNTAWYSPSVDNRNGPLTILPVLEEATSTWTNVNDMTYQMGVTDFGTGNSYTGCYSPASLSNCVQNSYTLPARTAKARMITIQEMSKFNCSAVVGSCPVWFSNYLKNSTSNGGVVNDDTTEGYLTMNVYTTDHIDNVWGADISRRIHFYWTYTTFGARAVVEINK